jgi:hypothetical protein
MWDHSVQPGENLWLIAQRYKKNLNEIFRLNPQIADKTKIWTGMIVHMPDPPLQGDVIIGPVTVTPGPETDPLQFKEPLPPDQDYKGQRSYVDNLTAGHYDTDSNTFYVDHADGSKIKLDFEKILNDQKGGVMFPVCWRDKRDGKIYPNVFTKATAPNIVFMVNDIDSVRWKGSPGMQIAQAIVKVVDLRLNSPLGMKAPRSVLSRGAGKVVVAGENGARIALDESKLKALAIQKWSTGGSNGLVKIVSSERGPLSDVGGYITQEKYIMGKTPAEMEKLLGLPAGELKNGANAMRLNRLPTASEFELRGYTNTPNGQPYVTGEAYPPGLGVPQWQISRGVQIPATPTKFVGPGEVY